MKNFKIVILDGYTTTQNDLNWECLNQLGQVTAYERTPKDKIIERAIDADAILTNKVPVFEEQLKDLPNLKYVGVLATGYNNVDLKITRDKKIDVTNIPAYGTESVAQSVFAHILNLANALEEHSISVRKSDWVNSKDICYCLRPLTEISGKTLGIIGYGAIGRKVAQIGKAFGMNIIAYSPSRYSQPSDGIAEFKSVEEIFKFSDIITLNCLLNEKTSKIVNSANLSLSKDGIWIINTGRGGLVDEEALAQALKSGKVSGAGLDVLSIEPPVASNPLLSAPNCHITPHNAWTTRQARERLINIAYNNLKEWQNANPINVVNK